MNPRVGYTQRASLRTHLRALRFPHHHHRRGPSRVLQKTPSAKLNDEPKFVRDTRDEARAGQPADVGERDHELEAFRDALTAGSPGDSPMT